MSSVQVDGITSDTTELQLREFFSYCGEIQDVKLHAPSCATIQFGTCESVEIALLLSGASINGAAITITDATPAGKSSAASPVRPSAVSSVNGLTASGLLVGARNTIDGIRGKAVELDTKYGIKDAVVAQVQSFRHAVGGLVNYVTGRDDKGEVQIACWYWKENQPQWGPDPRLQQTYKAAAAEALGYHY